MKPIDSTAEILAFKIMGYPVDKRWVTWAYDMLCAGFDTENIVVLAGEIEPFNQFELKNLTDKILKELGLTVDDRERILKNYACYLIGKAIYGKYSIEQVLSILTADYIGMNYDSFFRDFYMLHWAYDDLKHSDQQYYWEGATRENIDEITKAYFKEWITKYKTDD